MSYEVFPLVRLPEFLKHFLNHDVESRVILSVNLNLSVEVFRVDWAVLIKYFADPD